MCKGNFFGDYFEVIIIKVKDVLKQLELGLFYTSENGQSSLLPALPKGGCQTCPELYRVTCRPFMHVRTEIYVNVFD